MPKTVLFDKELVVQKVTELFWKNGFNGTSMQDLVDATGLNRSSIYNTFGDKEALFEESLKHYCASQSNLVSGLLEGSKSPLEDIKSFFKTVLSNIRQDADNKGCFLSNCTTELGNHSGWVQKLLVENKDTVVSIFENKIKQAIAEGEIDESKNAKRVALYLFSSLQGIRVTSILTKDQSDLELLATDILNNL